MTTSKITSLIITILIVAIGLVFMAIRIQAVIGWDRALEAWPLIALLTLIILLVAWFIFIAVRNKLMR